MNPGLGGYSGRCPFLHGAKTNPELMAALSALGPLLASQSGLEHGVHQATEPPAPKKSSNLAVTPLDTSFASADLLFPPGNGLSTAISTQSLTHTDEYAPQGIPSPKSTSQGRHEALPAAWTLARPIAGHNTPPTPENNHATVEPILPGDPGFYANDFFAWPQDNVNALNNGSSWQDDVATQFMWDNSAAFPPIPDQDRYAPLELDCGPSFSDILDMQTSKTRLNGSNIPKHEICHHNVDGLDSVHPMQPPLSRKNKWTPEGLQRTERNASMKRPKLSPTISSPEASDDSEDFLQFIETTDVESNSSPSGPDTTAPRSVNHSPACGRCRMAKKPCVPLPGQLCCKRCSRAKNKRNAAIVFGNEGTCNELKKLAPFTNYAEAHPTEMKKMKAIWENVIQGPYFFEHKESAFEQSEPIELLTSHFEASCSTEPPTHVHEATATGHQCALMQSPEGVKFYYAILALLVPYVGVDYTQEEVTVSAGIHAIRALGKLMKLRDFHKTSKEKTCAALACVFYALIAFVRIRNKIGKAREGHGVLFFDYSKFCEEDVSETIRVLSHYFLLIAERVELPLHYWYGEGDAKAKGFRYVQGICHFVRTFENKRDLALIEQVFGGSPLMRQATGSTGGRIA